MHLHLWLTVLTLLPTLIPCPNIFPFFPPTQIPCNFQVTVKLRHAHKKPPNHQSNGGRPLPPLKSWSIYCFASVFLFTAWQNSLFPHKNHHSNWILSSLSAMTYNFLNLSIIISKVCQLQLVFKVPSDQLTTSCQVHEGGLLL